MITLALAKFSGHSGLSLDRLTGGDNGINVPSRPEPFVFALRTNTFYYTTLIIFIATILMVTGIVRSPRRRLRGTRDQPPA